MREDVAIWLGVGLVVYVAICLFLGYLGTKRTKTAKDFAVAGYNVHPIMLGMALFATWFSASTYMGVPALSYSWGWPGMWTGFAVTLATPLATLAITDRLRYMAKRLDVRSMIDLVGERYQSGLIRFVFSIVVLMVMTMWCVGQYKGAGLLFSELLGLPFYIGVIVAALVTVLYMVTGGMWADIYTDAFQGILMILTPAVIIPFALIMAGGYVGVTQKLMAIKPELAGVVYPGTLYDEWSPILNIIYWIGYFLCNPVYMNRAMILRSRREVSKFIIVFSIGSFFAIFLMTGGAIARAMGIKVTPDFAIIQLLLNLLPSSIAGILLIGILAAIMSSVDGYGHTAAVTAGNDIYRRLMNSVYHKEPDEKTVLRIMQVVTAAVLIIPIYWVVVATPPYLSLFMYWAAAALMSCTFTPFVMGLFWKRATKAGLYAAVIVGILTFAYVDQVINPPGPYWRGVSAIVTSMIALIIVSLIDNKTLPREAIEKIWGKA